MSSSPPTEYIWEPGMTVGEFLRQNLSLDGETFLTLSSQPSHYQIIQSPDGGLEVVIPPPPPAPAPPPARTAGGWTATAAWAALGLAFVSVAIQLTSAIQGWERESIHYLDKEVIHLHQRSDRLESQVVELELKAGTLDDEELQRSMKDGEEAVERFFRPSPSRPNPPERPTYVRPW